MSFILITLSLNKVWMSLGENWCWSPMGLKGFTCTAVGWGCFCTKTYQNHTPAKQFDQLQMAFLRKLFSLVQSVELRLRRMRESGSACIAVSLRYFWPIQAKSCSTSFKWHFSVTCVGTCTIKIPDKNVIAPMYENYVVVQIYPSFKFYFPLFKLIIVHNHTLKERNLNQLLNHNIYSHFLQSTF